MPAITMMFSGGMIKHHEMRNVSFASGGDAETLAYIAYVAKSKIAGSSGARSPGGRACFVLECDSGLSQEVITTIGLAFELTFKVRSSTAPTEGSNNQKAIFGHQTKITN